MTSDDKRAMVLDMANAGLTCREVVERLGVDVAGSELAVRRVRRQDGRDARGWLALPQAAVLEEQDVDEDVASMMRGNWGPRRSTHLTAGENPGTNRLVTARRWPHGRHVYFIEAQTPERLIKIGCTENLDKRFNQLAATSAVPLVMLGFTPGYAHLEGRLHSFFAAQRQHGEWFRPTKKLLDVAAGNCNLAAMFGLPFAHDGQLGAS